MYAIRSIMIRYPERFENDFKGGQPGCLDPFSSSVNGVPGYPDRFWIQFSMAKNNSGRLFTCRACSLSGAFRLICFRFSLLSLSPPVSSKIIFDRYLPVSAILPNSEGLPIHCKNDLLGLLIDDWRFRKQELSFIGLPQESFFAWCWLAHATCSETTKKGSFNFHEWQKLKSRKKPRCKTAGTFETRAQIMLVPHCACVSYNNSGYLDTCKRFALTRVPSTRISGYLAIRIRVNAA